MKVAYKLRFVPLALGIVTLITGLVLKYIVFQDIVVGEVDCFSQNTGVSQNKTSFSFIYYGIGLTIIGIIFLQAVKQILRERQEKVEIKPVVSTKQQQEAEELEDLAYDTKNSMGFTIVRIIFAVLLMLGGLAVTITGQLDNMLLSIAWLLVGVLLTIYFILQFISQIQWLTNYKKSKTTKNIAVIKEVDIKNFSKQNNVILRVFNNNTSYLLFDFFPPNDSENFETLENDLEKYLGVQVTREDREIFLIMSSEEQVVKKVVAFFALTT